VGSVKGKNGRVNGKGQERGWLRGKGKCGGGLRGKERKGEGRANLKTPYHTLVNLW
jgi:hypothetical protein